MHPHQEQDEERIHSTLFHQQQQRNEVGVLSYPKSSMSSLQKQQQQQHAMLQQSTEPMDIDVDDNDVVPQNTEHGEDNDDEEDDDDYYNRKVPATVTTGADVETSTLGVDDHSHHVQQEQNMFTSSANMNNTENRRRHRQHTIRERVKDRHLRSNSTKTGFKSNIDNDNHLPMNNIHDSTGITSNIFNGNSTENQSNIHSLYPVQQQQSPSFSLPRPSWQQQNIFSSTHSTESTMNSAVNFNTTNSFPAAPYATSVSTPQIQSPPPKSVVLVDLAAIPSPVVDRNNISSLLLDDDGDEFPEQNQINQHYNNNDDNRNGNTNAGNDDDDDNNSNFAVMMMHNNNCNPTYNRDDRRQRRRRILNRTNGTTRSSTNRMPRNNGTMSNNNQTVISLISDTADTSSTDIVVVAEDTEEQQHQIGDDTNNNNNNEWDCRYCTLINPIANRHCEACGNENPSFVHSNNQTLQQRNDSTRQQQLINLEEYNDSDNISFIYNSDDDDTSTDNDEFMITRQFNTSTPGTTAAAAAATGSNTNSNSFGYAVGGGALFGSVLGTTSAFLRGRPLMSGAVQGAVSGAVGGALVREVLDPTIAVPTTTTTVSTARTRVLSTNDRSRNTPVVSISYDSNQGRRRQQQGTDRQSQQQRQYPTMHRENVRMLPHDVAVAAATASSTSTNSAAMNRRNRQQTRRPAISYSTNNRRVIINTNRNNNNRRRQLAAGLSDEDGFDGPDAAMIRFFMNEIYNNDERIPRRNNRTANTTRTSTTGNNIDRMTYEQILQQFGNGTDNMGSSIEVISSLPVSTIIDPMRELPEDDNYQQCSICLEDYTATSSSTNNNNRRMTLPCLHGYHEHCATKWLLSNGSCPICKHKVSV
jgi:Ring finger domain